MKKLRVIQVGVEHDHAGAAMRSLLARPEIFEVVGYSRCGLDRLPDEEAYKGVPEYSVEEIYELPDIDAAIIESYELDLTKYARMALEKGLHTYMDKPGGSDPDEFDAMVDLAKEKNLIFHTGYMYRYNPCVKKLMERIKNGDLGEIYSVEAQMNCYHPQKKRQWLDAFPGGMMFFLGCHLVELIVSIQGIPEDIIPFNMSTGIGDVTANDLGFAVFKYKNGISFAKSCATEHGGFLRRQLVVHGSKGSVEIKPFEINAFTSFGQQLTEMSETFAEKDDFSPWNYKGDFVTSEEYNRYIPMLEAFAKMVNGELENPYSYEYEKQLHKVVLKACGVDIDYK